MIRNDADAHDLAVLEKLGDGIASGLIGQVAEVGSERRPLRELLGEVVAKGVEAW